MAEDTTKKRKDIFGIPVSESRSSLVEMRDMESIGDDGGPSGLKDHPQPQKSPTLRSILSSSNPALKQKSAQVGPFLARVEILFDTLERKFKSSDYRKRVFSVVVFIFLLSLVLIQLNYMGALPSYVMASLPLNHFYAIDIALTLVLTNGVLSLVFAIPSAMSRATGKQFEIFALILLRECFKEFIYFEEPLTWHSVTTPIYHILTNFASAIVMFLIVGLFYRFSLKAELDETPDAPKFICHKKLVSLFLLGAFACLGSVDFIRYVVQNSANRKMDDVGEYNFHFFQILYTVMVFSDVFLVFISLKYVPEFHTLFRNTSFALATVILRIALVSPPPYHALLALATALLLLLTAILHERLAPIFNQLTRPSSV